MGHREEATRNTQGARCMIFANNAVTSPSQSCCSSMYLLLPVLWWLCAGAVGAFARATAPQQSATAPPVGPAGQTSRIGRYCSKKHFFLHISKPLCKCPFIVEHTRHVYRLLCKSSHARIKPFTGIYLNQPALLLFITTPAPAQDRVVRLQAGFPCCPRGTQREGERVCCCGGGGVCGVVVVVVIIVVVAGCPG